MPPRTHGIFIEPYLNSLTTIDLPEEIPATGGK